MSCMSSDNLEKRKARAATFVCRTSSDCEASSPVGSVYPDANNALHPRMSITERNRLLHILKFVSFVNESTLIDFSSATRRSFVTPDETSFGLITCKDGALTVLGSVLVKSDASLLSLSAVDDI